MWLFAQRRLIIITIEMTPRILESILLYLNLFFVFIETIIVAKSMYTLQY
jgi:hypothetical protein